MLQPATQTERDKFLEFDPNAPEMKPFATYAHRRQIQFRMHPRRAQALQTYAQYKNLATIYYWSPNDREWKVLATKDRESKNVTCDNCNRTTAEHFPKNGYTPWHLRNGRGLDPNQYGPDMYDGGQFVWWRKNKKLVEPLTQMFLCNQCRPRFA